MNQFKALKDDEKLAFTKEAMSAVTEILENDPQRMRSEIMPLSRNVMQSKRLDMDVMRDMMKTIMG